MEPRPLKVLLIRLSALGDVLVSLPALRCLRAAWPRAEIHFAIQDELAPVLEGHPDLDRVVAVPARAVRARLANPLTWPAALGELRRLGARLRAEAYDLVLDLQGNFKSGLLTWLTGAPRRIGPAPGEARELEPLFVTERPKAPPSTRRHRADRALALLAVLGIEPEYLPPRLPSYPLDWARRMLGAGAGPIVLLHPGSSPRTAFKRWPPAAFGEVARRLAEGNAARVLVLGGPGEESLVRAVEAASAGSARGLPPAPGLRELAGLIGQADLYLGADSGPAHLADAAGVPAVVLFGPKDPMLYGPRGRGLAVRLELACSPCGRRACPLARVFCMEDLPAAAVARVCGSVLERSLPAGTTRVGDVRVLVVPGGQPAPVVRS